MDLLKKGEKQMKKLITCTIMVLLMILSVSCKEKKSMQEEFDYYIENEDFEGIKKLEGKYFKYAETRSFDNQLLAKTYAICSDIDFDIKNLYRDASIVVYTNKMKPNFSIVYTEFSVRPIKKPKNYKGVDTQIDKIMLINTEPGYCLFSYAACKYDENGEIVLAGPVMCLRKAKIYEDGSTENITVWNKKLTPDYVIEIESPDKFTVTKGEDSEYFYYYDENHAIY